MSKFTELIKDHGTIEEFITACENAYDDGFVTWEEKETAIKEYALELANADAELFTGEQNNGNMS